MKSLNSLKVVIAAILLLCLADMPYGYYVFVRTVSMISFAVLAYHASKTERQTEFMIYLGLAVLFQPFFKIALGRELWNIVDVVVAIGLLISILNQLKKS